MKALGQPVLQGAGQELLLVGVVGDVACAHARISTNPVLLGIRIFPSAAQTPRKYTFSPKTKKL